MQCRSCPYPLTRVTTLTALFFALATSVGAQESGRLYECLIQPRKVVQIGSRSTGILETVDVDRGTIVTVGQTIATLNSDIETTSLRLAEERANTTINIELAEARRAFEESTLARVQTLFDRKITSEQEIETARASFEIARLQVSSAEQQKVEAQLDYARAKAVFDLLTIRSPLEGVVMGTSLSPGEYVSETSVIATIAEIDPLYVEAFLPLMMIDQVAVGDKVEVRPQEPVGGSIPGVIDVVDSVVDARSGTIGVRVLVENPDKRTLAGLGCKIRF